MGWWTEHVVPRLADRALRAPEIFELRAQACQGLRGHVLELGFGSGLNVAAWPPEVTAVDVVEPSDVGWAMSAPRRERADIPITRVGLDGEVITAPDASYDAVLSTFTLCTIPDPGRALAEVRRVLRPEGRFHFLEHGLSPEPQVARWQHRLEPAQRRLAGGCHLSRDVPALVRAAGLEITAVEARYLPGPAVAKPWSYGYLGQAVRVA